MAFTFPAMVAWDPTGKQTVKNVSFQVYAPADTAFTTPLTITDPFGGAMVGNILNSGTMGVFPQFQQASNATVVIADAAKMYAWTVIAIQPPTPDSAVAGYINTTGSASALAVKSEVTTGATKTTLDGNYVGKGRAICKGYTRTDVVNCINAAEALGKYSVAYFPAGTYDVGNGLSLSGYTCMIQGDGAGGYVSGAERGTTFYASTQTGPVLDFTGWVVPVDSGGQAFTAHVNFFGFKVKGSGVADATKNNSGIRLAAMNSAAFSDIAITGTGGPCLEGVSSPGNAVYLCDFERIILNTPVGAKTNDVPYFIMNECNGNRFGGIGFRSVGAVSGDCGVSGALRIVNNASYTGYSNVFDGCWFEYLHVPTNGSLINVAVNGTRFHEFSFHDNVKETGATNTAAVRFNVPTLQDYGGNIWSGLVPGGDGTATGIDSGIVLNQSRNRIEGTRGYSGSNVTIASGVLNSYVELGGSWSIPIGSAVTDSSGNATNVVVDATNGNFAVNRLVVKDLVTPANGSLTLGGVVIQGVGATAVSYADYIKLYNNAGTGPGILEFGAGVAGILTGSGSPNSVVTAPPGWIYLNSAGGAAATIWVKESGTGNTGWVAK